MWNRTHHCLHSLPLIHLQPPMNRNRKRCPQKAPGMGAPLLYVQDDGVPQAGRGCGPLTLCPTSGLVLTQRGLSFPSLCSCRPCPGALHPQLHHHQPASHGRHVAWLCKVQRHRVSCTTPGESPLLPTSLPTPPHPLSVSTLHFRRMWKVGEAGSCRFKTWNCHRQVMCDLPVFVFFF